MRLLPIALALALAGCATTGAGVAKVVTREVPVPVPVKCRPNLGPAPAYPDTDQALRAAPDLFGRVQLLAVGRLQRIAHEAELLAALGACEG
jgi:hypothetical protein